MGGRQRRRWLVHSIFKSTSTLHTSHHSLLTHHPPNTPPPHPTPPQVYRAAKEANAPSACRRAVAEVPVAVGVALLGAMQPHMTEEQGRALAASLSEVFEGL